MMACPIPPERFSGRGRNLVESLEFRVESSLCDDLVLPFFFLESLREEL